MKREETMRLLVVEDDRDMNRIIVKCLEEEEYNVDRCYDGAAAVDYLLSESYDGAVLDVMLPGLDGFAVLEKIRKAGVQTPVLFLTARDDTADIVTGLNCGADDYIIKPFVLAEFLARVKVLVRKAEIRENVYCCGDLKIDCNTHEVFRAGQRIRLSPKEFWILLYLVRNQNIIVTREQIEANIWNIDYSGNSNVVDVYIRYLRRKIDDDYEEKMIQTIRGVGYMLKCKK